MGSATCTTSRISLALARRIGQGLGFRASDKWTPALWVKKAGQLAAWDAAGKLDRAGLSAEERVALDEMLTAARDPEGCVEVYEEGPAGNGSVAVPAPKKRGRPPKAQPVLEQQPPPVPKRRGRPPKARQEPEAAVAATAPALVQGRSLSMLEAAVRVLREARRALTVRELTERMAVRGYWTSPAGKTPQATLAGAIGTEIKKKGDASRFVRVSLGLFALRK